MESIPPPRGSTISTARSPSIPSPKPVIVTLGEKPSRDSSFRRLRSLSMQQQTVISAEGEAALVLRSHGILGSNSSNTSTNGIGLTERNSSHDTRKNSLDNSNHGFHLMSFPSEKKTLDYSFHGSELPDDVPDDFDYGKEKEISSRMTSDQIENMAKQRHSPYPDTDNKDTITSKLFETIKK
jgi:hypothetical protein